MSKPTVAYSIPGLASIRQLDTHRLIPSILGRKEGRGGLERIADDDGHLPDLVDMDSATNDRLLAESGWFPGIGVDELVAGIPNHHIVNAAFTHTHGNRFNSSDRGAWYAGFEIETSQAEIAWHVSCDLDEIGVVEESIAYDDYLADFSGEYHEIREGTAFGQCLDPDSYVESRKLAETLLMAGSPGIIYPSVRRTGGTCIACFRPALVSNVRKAARYRFTWSGSNRPGIEKEEDYA